MSVSTNVPQAPRTTPHEPCTKTNANQSEIIGRRAIKLETHGARPIWTNVNSHCRLITLTLYRCKLTHTQTHRSFPPSDKPPVSRVVSVMFPNVRGDLRCDEEREWRNHVR